MIDLYEGIGVPFGSSEDVIKLAVAKTRLSNAKLADRASAILMFPQRRRAYDRLWISLTRIGRVRALAELNDSPFGSMADYAEFKFLSPPASRAEADGGTNRSSLRHSLLIQTLIAGAPLALALALGWFFDHSGSIQPSTSGKPIPTESASAAAAQATAERQARDLLARSNEAGREAQKKLEASWQLPEFKAKPLPLPKTGEGSTLVASARENWIQIKTSGNHHTLVRVERPNGQLVAKRFIRAGDTHRIYLPLGTYVLKTATGKLWFGDKKRFGPETSYSKPDDTFPLNKPGEYWEVELILQERGNLSQSAISEAEFGAD